MARLPHPNDAAPGFYEWRVPLRNPWRAIKRGPPAASGRCGTGFLRMEGSSKNPLAGRKRGPPAASGRRGTGFLRAAALGKAQKRFFRVPPGGVKETSVRVFRAVHGRRLEDLAGWKSGKKGKQRSPYSRHSGAAGLSPTAPLSIRWFVFVRKSILAAAPRYPVKDAAVFACGTAARRKGMAGILCAIPSAAA